MSSESPNIARNQRRGPGRPKGQPQAQWLSPFPDIPALKMAMTARVWSVRDLAKEAGIGTATAYRALAGRALHADTIERICRAVVDTPARTATAAFLRQGAA